MTCWCRCWSFNDVAMVDVYGVSASDVDARYPSLPSLGHSSIQHNIALSLMERKFPVDYPPPWKGKRESIKDFSVVEQSSWGKIMFLIHSYRYTQLHIRMSCRVVFFLSLPFLTRTRRHVHLEKLDSYSLSWTREEDKCIQEVRKRSLKCTLELHSSEPAIYNSKSISLSSFLPRKACFPFPLLSWDMRRREEMKKHSLLDPEEQKTRYVPHLVSCCVYSTRWHEISFYRVCIFVLSSCLCTKYIGHCTGSNLSFSPLFSLKRF